MKKSNFMISMAMPRIKRKYGRESCFTLRKSGWVFNIRIATSGNGIKTVEQIKTHTSSYTKAVMKVLEYANRCSHNVYQYENQYTASRVDESCRQV